MKNSFLISCIVCLSFLFTQAQTTAIPDLVFEEYLETHTSEGEEVNEGDPSSMGDGTIGNGLVETDRIDTVTLLDIGDLGISDLTGIQDFLLLETLITSENNLTILDVSNNTELISLLTGSNSLTNLDVSNNVNLETLNCSDNQLQGLNVSNNLELTSLTASGNQISSIDVSNNTELTVLSISSNRVEGVLDISNNTNLEGLFCASNQITAINLNANTLLRNLDASDNQLTTLDLTTINTVVCPDPQTDPLTVCQDIATINVSRNQLSSLVVNNGFNDLFSVFDATDNPDLFCIQIDADFTVPANWIKDDWTYYSDTTCVDIFTYVPDDNFEQELINQGFDDTLDNLVLTTNIAGTTNLDVSGNAISDLTGIEDFSSLEILNVSANDLDEIDISLNITLQELDVSANNVSNIDLSSNSDLTQLNLDNNAIEALDISANTNLTVLNCSNNNLSNLVLDTNVLLTDLDCSFNQIERLDLSTNINITTVGCNNNNLFALNINNGNNALITTFDATNNANLFCISVDDVAFANAAAGWAKDATASYELDCGTYVPDDNFEQALIDQGIDSDGTLNNYVPTGDVVGVTTLIVDNLGIIDLTGIEDFDALLDLNVSDNNLSELDLSTNLNLVTLDCSANSITGLELTSNTALTSLNCSNNALQNLNIKNGNNAALTVFDATNNPNLYCITVDDAIVGNVPGSWQVDPFVDFNGDCLNNRFTPIPDQQFEQALIDLNIDDVIDGQVLTANIEHIQELNVSDESIADLTGIRDFQSLVELDCSGNFLDDLDVSNMIYLQRLNCSSNYLLTNDVNNTNGLFNTSGTIALVELFCANNNLNDLDTSENINLEILACANNNITTIDVTGNTLLTQLNCSNNGLTDLDVSNNDVLEELNCDNNSIDNLLTADTNNSFMTILSCSNNNISSLVLTNYSDLERLNCSSNQLTQLTTTSNSALYFISASNNELSTVDFQNNTALVELYLSQNSLSTLDLVANTALEQLNCSFNELTSLNVNSNTALEQLSSSSNQLSSVTLNAVFSFIEIDLSSNQLENIELAANLENLKQLNLSSNQIQGDLELTTIALSACVFEQNQTQFCPENIGINVANNLFDFINIQNGINDDIVDFNASGNPNLECIQVDDPNNTGVNWLKDATTEYSVDCNFGETFVPDDNFEQALIDLGLDTAPLNDYVFTSNIEDLVTLDVSGNAIADFTGIEDFLALENLNSANNNLSALNLSSNTNLTVVNCSGNQIEDLDISNSEELVTLDCSNNLLTELDLTNNISLADLNITENAFSTFLPSEVLSLQVFNCDNNSLSDLDFQFNQSLTAISCQFNNLETLNIKNGQNAILTNLNAQNNPDLTCIETDTGTVPSGATWLIDATAEFATECNFGETFVPDDNFEQALIDLGYDSGSLDDYVFTENINELTFLDVSGLEIQDITGIEDFVSLIVLNFENNNIANVDLSQNNLILNLDASGNQLTSLDVSTLIELQVLDLSNNALTTINLDVNNDLVDLEISNNQLTNLNVANLPLLMDLNCASNQIESLDITSNNILEVLFCQSNALVADQLNLQNGNNENLQLFNATNNQDLACILVDDPVAINANENGTYDNWFKDESASYQLICEDADNDGVPNDDDLCPNTEFGVPVDLFGCALPDFPNDNFTVSITSETCLNSNNGQITIVAQQLYAYTATLSNEDFYQEYNFTNDVDIFNLLAGTYELCITVEEWPDYEICYTIVITEPNPLDAFASRSPSGRQLNVALGGSSRYHIEFNDEVFTTHNSSLTLELENGINSLKITTDFPCQGIYEKQFALIDGFKVYPNPFNDEIHLYSGLPTEDEVHVKIYNSYGQLVLSEVNFNANQDLIIKTDRLAIGVYLLSVQHGEDFWTYKIVKK